MYHDQSSPHIPCLPYLYKIHLIIKPNAPKTAPASTPACALSPPAFLVEDMTDAGAVLAALPVVVEVVVALPVLEVDREIIVEAAERLVEVAVNVGAAVAPTISVVIDLSGDVYSPVL
jgi:hypothetical protein